MIAKRKLNSENWKVTCTALQRNITDAHCSISIRVDGEGYLHLAWNQHDNTLHYCKSIGSDTMIFREEEPMRGINEDQVSYPEFYKLPGGDLIFMYRDGSSGNGNLIMNHYSISDQQWKKLQTHLIDDEVERNAYWQACVDNKGTIHISWIWRESWDVSTNHDLCYAKSTDGGITWQKSNGVVYNLPVTRSNAEYICRIPEGSELINQIPMVTDTHGNPYIAGYWTPEN